MSKSNKCENSSENPFKDLKISSWDPLRNVSRAPCPVCGRSRKYYCYDCYVLVGISKHLVPSVTLPVKVDIVKHINEVTGKSTATHAKILSPDCVNIYQFPDMPNYEKETTVLVYPKEGSLTIEQLASSLKKDKDQPSLASPLRNLERVVFIDSTWSQSYAIRTHSNLCDLVCVQLKDAVTFFWRTQNKSPNHLATIEAIYYFVREYHNHMLSDPYYGQYDDLLYYFAYQYEVVQQAMIERDTAAAQKRSADDSNDDQDPDIYWKRKKHPKTD